MLHGVIVHCCHIVYVRHSEGNDVVVVRVVDVHASDLDLASVEEEFARLWIRGTNDQQCQKKKNIF